MKNFIKMTLIFFIILATNYLKVNTQQVNHNRELFDKYTPIDGYNVITTQINTNLIEANVVANKYDCFSRCSSISHCVLVLINQNECKLYSTINFSNFISYTGTPCLFKKYKEDYSSINANLKYYWPFNGNGNEIISGANVIAGSSYSFSSTDRLNSPSSAVFINNGYMSLPAQNYINTDFTITAWINPQTYPASNQRLLHFSDASWHDVVLIDLCVKINFAIVNNGQQRTLSIQNQPCGKWYHLAVTLQGTTGTIYINGKMKTQGALYTVRNILHTNAVFGSANAGSSGSIGAIFDDIKVFNRSLTETEIMKVINSYY